jgi:predicted 3-demethylubiquinone-9 3-methyltransferase (glyoxalase superfamily)
MMAPTALPFLMFQGDAEKAMNFYVENIPGSKVIEIVRYGAGEPGPEGSVKKAMFSVAGQIVICIDSPIKHAFTFTPSFSFFIECESEEQIRRMTPALAEGGAVLMPLDSYGFSREFAWVSDRFGVSWQLNLK